MCIYIYWNIHIVAVKWTRTKPFYRISDFLVISSFQLLMCPHILLLYCFEYLYSFSYSLQLYALNWFVIIRRMPSLLHLLSNHPWSRGCSVFLVVHLCLISLVYSYSSEIIDRCFQGCALTCHQLHQQAPSHTESIRDCSLHTCLYVCMCGILS